jgi:predicted Zn-dependent protease
MGLILLKQHRYEESLRFARRLLKLRPNHRSPNLQIGVALTQMGRPDKGNWFLWRAFHSDPGNLVVMLCMLENRLVAGEMVQANIIRTYLRDHYATDRLQSVLVNGVNEVGDPGRLRAYLENVKS